MAKDSNIVNSPLLLVYSSTRILFQIYDEFLAPFGLTYTKYLALLCIERKQICSINDIGELLALDSGTLSPLIKKLESRGLVSRQRSYEDERKLRINLTEKGSALMSETHQVYHTINQKLAPLAQEMLTLENIWNNLQTYKSMRKRNRNQKYQSHTKSTPDPCLMEERLESRLTWVETQS